MSILLTKLLEESGVKDSADSPLKGGRLLTYGFDIHIAALPPTESVSRTAHLTRLVEKLTSPSSN